MNYVSHWINQHQWLDHHNGFVTAIATIVYTLITGWLALLTYLTLRQSKEISKASLDSWIVMNLVPGRLKNDGMFDFAYTVVRNVGPSIASNIRIISEQNYFYWGLGDAPGIFKRSFVLGPGDTVKVKTAVPESKEIPTRKYCIEWDSPAGIHHKETINLDLSVVKMPYSYGYESELSIQ